jgi:hypothetical protein
MLTFEDCLALCDLSEEEIEAIAEHEHLPEIVALELGQYLCHSPDGIPMLRRMILEDMDAARHRGDLDRIERLKRAIGHFIKTHPEYERRHHPRPGGPPPPWHSG